jgi:hypothetical protein
MASGAYYFAEDGSYGLAMDIEILDIEEYPFTEEDWQAIDEASDTERLEVVRGIKYKYDKKEVG